MEEEVRYEGKGEEEVSPWTWQGWVLDVNFLIETFDFWRVVMLRDSESGGIIFDNSGNSGYIHRLEGGD